MLLRASQKQDNNLAVLFFGSRTTLPSGSAVIGLKKIIYQLLSVSLCSFQMLKFLKNIFNLLQNPLAQRSIFPFQFSSISHLHFHCHSQAFYPQDCVLTYKNYYQEQPEKITRKLIINSKSLFVQFHIYLFIFVIQGDIHASKYFSAIFGIDDRTDQREAQDRHLFDSTLMVSFQVPKKYYQFMKF